MCNEYFPILLCVTCNIRIIGLLPAEPIEDHFASMHIQADDGNCGSGSEHESDDVDMKARRKNMENAKRTRIRKKEFIETLHKTVKSLCEEAENDEREMRLHMHHAATQVLPPHQCICVKAIQ